ncbi:ceramide synthase 3a-related [Anaeramoeba ignava]|uniref:Ceramide synthase 3a-related n=1 Tax=Anaeramoeba ignava TaxID=1746090 RepID=A0A9Q0L6U8_ANAIG|nr:ceramide synthase 3a-related [Anaeramoeba ignava]
METLCIKAILMNEEELLSNYRPQKSTCPTPISTPRIMEMEPNKKINNSLNEKFENQNSYKFFNPSQFVPINPQSYTQQHNYIQPHMPQVISTQPTSEDSSFLFRRSSRELAPFNAPNLNQSQESFPKDPLLESPFYIISSNRTKNTHPQKQHPSFSQSNDPSKTTQENLPGKNFSLPNSFSQNENSNENLNEIQIQNEIQNQIQNEKWNEDLNSKDTPLNLENLEKRFSIPDPLGLNKNLLVQKNSQNDQHQKIEKSSLATKSKKRQSKVQNTNVSANNTLNENTFSTSISNDDNKTTKKRATQRRMPTKQEKNFLKQFFVKNQNPTQKELESLAEHLKWDKKRVSRWFSNQKSRTPKETILRMQEKKINKQQKQLSLLENQLQEQEKSQTKLLQMVLEKIDLSLENIGNILMRFSNGNNLKNSLNSEQVINIHSLVLTAKHLMTNFQQNVIEHFENPKNSPLEQSDSNSDSSFVSKEEELLKRVEKIEQHVKQPNKKRSKENNNRTFKKTKTKSNSKSKSKSNSKNYKPFFDDDDDFEDENDFSN